MKYHAMIAKILIKMVLGKKFIAMQNRMEVICRLKQKMENANFLN